MTIPLDLFLRIARFNTDYCRCIDSDRLEEWPDFFVEDCLYRITSLENFGAGLPASIIHAGSRGMLSDRVSALRQANIYERHSYRHVVSQPAVLSEDAGSAASETTFIVVRVMHRGPTEIFATGTYHDRFVMTDAGLKLSERVVVCDSSRIDTLLALPL